MKCRVNSPLNGPFGIGTCPYYFRKCLIADTSFSNTPTIIPARNINLLIPDYWSTAVQKRLSGEHLACFIPAHQDSLVFREISQHDLHLTYTSGHLRVARIVCNSLTFHSDLLSCWMSQHPSVALSRQLRPSWGEISESFFVTR